MDLDALANSEVLFDADLDALSNSEVLIDVDLDALSNSEALVNDVLAEADVLFSLNDSHAEISVLSEADVLTLADADVLFALNDSYAETSVLSEADVLALADVLTLADDDKEVDALLFAFTDSHASQCEASVLSEAEILVETDSDAVEFDPLTIPVPLKATPVRIAWPLRISR